MGVLVSGALVVSGLGAVLSAPAEAAVGQGFNLNASDLRFVLKQIKIAEQHTRTATAANPCGTLLGSGVDQIPNQNGQGVLLPWGLRTIDGTCNNLTPGNTRLGAADNTFPRRTTPQFDDAQNVPAGFGPPGPSSYKQKSGSVFDSQPRTASNLIVDQTSRPGPDGILRDNPTTAVDESADNLGNPAALAAAALDTVPDPDSGTLFIQNTAPDVGLSAPYNSWFTLFGQFFDHGLDLTNKGGSGTVFMPLKADDPLFNPAPGSPNFMVLTRSTNQPGPDGIVGDPVAAAPDTSLDDVQNATNQTSTFVDQSQTYTSHPSHQVFLREYANNAAGDPVSTGKMLTGPGAGLATWQSAKAQAVALLGITLSDQDVLNVPLLATDQYGKFIPGPNGFPQLVVPSAATGLVEGNPAAPVTTAGATRTNHAFLDDIAHHAVPKAGLTADPDSGITAADATQPAGTYDDEMLRAHFVAGDGRVNENIGLSAVHQVFHSEHNRLVGGAAAVTGGSDIKSVITNEDPTQLAQWKLADGSWNGERLFQAARFVTEMEYQHLAFEEFARKVQPMVNLFAGYDTSVDPAIVAEFAHSVYRFGHSMLTETVARTTRTGGNRDIPLLNAFLNPPSYAAGGLTPEQASGDIVRGMTDQYGNELDEFVTEALRNRLLGLPLDLASLNMARGRETGTPSLNGARRQFFAQTNGNSALAPYANWLDFGLEIKHPESLINFVGAYGTHPSITGATTSAAKRTAAALLVANDPLNGATPPDSAAFMNGTGVWANAGGTTTTGLDDVDLWVGGLAEKQAPFGGLLGSSFNFIFETQMENLQDGDRMYYLTRTAGLNMLVQLEGNSFSELITRNTDAVNLPADVFSRPDLKFDLSVQGNTPGTPIVDDPATLDYNETTLLSRMTDGTVRYAGPLHVVFNGSADLAQADWARSSEGDDTLRGNDGDDRFEGGAGNDGFIGGLGQDILTDSFGDDVLKGGDGNDAMSSGPGFDLNQGGRGNDFVVGGSDPTETFGGPGNDMIFGGDSTDTVFGDDGDDWIEGGGQADLLQGDNGAPFQDDPNAPGNDVINGNGGADDYDSEGGDDIMVAGAGVERNEGMLGFDWVTHKNETAGAGVPVDAIDDMNVTGLLPPSVEVLRDRFDLVESLSGWDGNDTLRGDDFDAVTTQPGNVLDAAGIARVTGLAGLLPVGATSFTGGNIIIGGAGNDLIEGRGGDDIIDGDKWLNVQLRAPDLSTPEVLDTKRVDNMALLQADVFAGRINAGDVTIVRTVEAGSAGSAVDTVAFSGPRADYDITFGATATVAHTRGTAIDGTDTIRNAELLQFTDQTIPAGAPVTTAPGAPTDVTAVAGDAQATVSFTPPVNDGGSTITGFTVRVVDAANAQVGALRPAAGSPVVVTGLTNGQAYRFEVTATNAVGTSAPSALSAAVTPVAANVAPTVTVQGPANGAVGVAVGTNVTATFSENVIGVNGARFTLRLGAGAGGTIVPRAVTYNAATVTATLNPNANLLPGTLYTARLLAGITDTATPGAPLAPVSWSFTTAATVPGAPVIGTAVPGVVGGAITATANWNPPANNGGSVITGYRIRALRMSAAGAVLATTTSTVQPAASRTLSMTLPVAGNYRFTAQAINAVNPAGGAQSARSNLVAGR